MISSKLLFRRGISSAVSSGLGTASSVAPSELGIRAILKNEGFLHWYSPAGVLENIVCGMNTVVGLPWWASISATAALLPIGMQLSFKTYSSQYQFTRKSLDNQQLLRDVEDVMAQVNQKSDTSNNNASSMVKPKSQQDMKDITTKYQKLEKELSFPNFSSAYDAIFFYWGTASAASMSQSIHHFTHDPSVAFLTAPAPTALALLTTGYAVSTFWRGARLFAVLQPAHTELMIRTIATLPAAYLLLISNYNWAALIFSGSWVVSRWLVDRLLVQPAHLKAGALAKLEYRGGFRRPMRIGDMWKLAGKSVTKLQT